MLYRIQTRLWEETLTGEGEPVLVCSGAVPELALLEERALRRVNGYYAHAQRRFQHWCRKRLFPAAERCRRQARERSRPFEPWTARLSWESRSEEGSDLLSVELLVSAPGFGERRSLQRWDLRDGFPDLSNGT